MSHDRNPIYVPVDGVELEAELVVPPGAPGIVVFAHGSGSSRKSPRNNRVAASLRDRGLGTLLFDLLTEREDRNYENRFDIPLLTDRLVGVTEWLRGRGDTADLHVGYFGSSTGAAAALRGAARLGPEVDAVVSRGGRVDLASESLGSVRAAALFVVGGEDDDVLERNREAFEVLGYEKDLHVVAGAGHLFEEPGALEEVSEVAGEWFERHLA